MVWKTGRATVWNLREGRGVSDQYGVKDAACPISTKGVPTAPL